jgi:hypothetical protein
MDWSIVSSVSTMVSAIVGVILCYQLFQTKKQFLENHRIQRNVYTTDLMRWWIENITSSMEAARQFVERLSIDQCEMIIKGGNIKLVLLSTEDNKSDYMIDKLKICLGDNYSKIKVLNDIVEIESPETARIKSLCAKYLNTTETVLSAWRHNTANREIIAEEFEYIIHGKKNFKMLENFRLKNGGVECFPSIIEFIESMKNAKQQAGEKPANI